MIPERYAPAVYSLFRAVFGFLFLCHGLQKFGLLGGLDGKGAAAPLASQFGAAAKRVAHERYCDTAIVPMYEAYYRETIDKVAHRHP